MAGIKRQKRFPIGYRIQNGRAEVVPEEAELVQRIFRDYLEGSTTYGIAKWMTELGVLNANGHPSWSHASIGSCFCRYRRDGKIEPASWDAGIIQTVMQARAF